MSLQDEFKKMATSPAKQPEAITPEPAAPTGGRLEQAFKQSFSGSEYDPTSARRQELDRLMADLDQNYGFGGGGTPPDPSAGYSMLSGLIESTETEYRQAARAVSVYEQEAQKLYEQAAKQMQQLQKLMTSYQKEQSQGLYDQIVTGSRELENTRQQYASRMAARDKAVQLAEDSGIRYGAATSAARQYSQQAGKAWEDWRGGIRTQPEIMADLQNMKVQISNLANVGYAQDSEPMQKLLAQQQKLQEEMQWADALEPEGQLLSHDERVTRDNMRIIDQMTDEEKADLLLVGQASAGPGTLLESIKSDRAMSRLLKKGYEKDQLIKLGETMVRKENKEFMEDTKTAGQNSPAVLGNLAAIAANMGAGITGNEATIQEVLRQKLGLSQYENVDINNPGYAPGVYAANVRQSSRENIEKIGGANGQAGAIGKILAAGYGGLTSAADSYLRMKATGPFSLMLAGMSSAQDEFRQVVERGGSTNQAAAMGLISGALEVITEEISLDKLIEMKAPENFVKFLRNIAVQGGIEASEEELNLLGNMAADALIMADKSELNQAIRNYMAQGMSKEEATRKAWKDVGMEALATGIESALSGGMMASAESAVKTVQMRNDLAQRVKNAQLSTEEKQAYIDEALAAKEGTDARNWAEKLRKKGITGEKITDRQLGILWEANIRAEAAGLLGDEEAAAEVQQDEESAAEVQQEETEDNVGTTEEDVGTTGQQEQAQPQGLTLRAVDETAGTENKAGKIQTGASQEGMVTQEEYNRQIEEQDQQDSWAESALGSGRLSQSEYDGEMEISRQHREQLARQLNAWKESRKSTQQEAPEGLRLGQVQEDQARAEEELLPGIPMNPEMKGTVNNGKIGTAEAGTEGTGIYDGSQERDAGPGPGKQAGAMGVLSGAPGRESDAQAQRRNNRSHYKSRLRQQGEKAVSAKDLGLKTGTERKQNYVIPQDMWDEDIREAAKAVQDDAGLEAIFVTGEIQVTGADDQLRKVRAVNTGDKVIIRADHSSVMPQQLADHEIYHTKSARMPALNKYIRKGITEQYSEEEFEEVLGKYIGAMAGVYDVDGISEDARNVIAEETFADAYAGINAFGAHADKFTETVNKTMDEMYVGKARRQDNGTRQTRGPDRETGSNYSVDDEEAPTKAGKEIVTQLDIAMDREDGGYGRPENRTDIARTPEAEVKYSLENDDAYMTKAVAKNKKANYPVPENVMAKAKTDREQTANRLRKMVEKGVLLPDDKAGNTYIANSAYVGTEENTTLCPRSMVAEAFMDQVAEYIGRPLTVQEQLFVSQDLQNLTPTPECLYCYVANDRKAYREFLGSYLQQRNDVLKKYDEGMTDLGELYKEFLGKRKPTDNMKKRFDRWISNHIQGKPMVQPEQLAKIDNLMGTAAQLRKRFGPVYEELNDALKYAQSASWAKKRIAYLAYNGHILNWKQDRINKLNGHYGLRMYSFSDYSPAFVLENMQMVTDAAVRGLKMLAYTKEAEFAKIFAPTGMNINISTFGFERSGTVAENNLIGAAWKDAQELRAKYPNVGVTFVATSDKLVEWGLAQDWIDVVIPYHLVRTGQQLADALGYTNYTAESADRKADGWTKDVDQASIMPTEHNNDKQTYLEALERNHLKPRFERWMDNPNYMKLVNECRRPASESTPVQPVFDMSYVNETLARLETEGYARPIGGSKDKMQELAFKTYEDMDRQGIIRQDVYSVDDEDYMAAVKSGNMEEAQRMVDQAAKDAGYDLNLYHQTASEFTKFNTNHEFAGRSDTDTPTGFFFKPTDKNIGLQGDTQMHVFVKAHDLLEFRNRDEIHKYWMENVKGYRSLQEELDALDKKYDAMYEEAEEASDEWYEEHYDDYVAGRISYAEVMEHTDAPLGKILDEWKAKENPIRAEMKKLVTEYMHGTKYDGIHLVFDGRRAGVDVETYIVFDPARIKSAEPVTYSDSGEVIPLSERFSGDPDIRYSTDDDETIREADEQTLRELEAIDVSTLDPLQAKQLEFDKAEARAKNEARRKRQQVMEEALGAEGVKEFQKDRQAKEEREKAERKADAKTRRDQKYQDLRRQKARVMSETKAQAAKGSFRKNVMSLFSIGKDADPDTRKQIGGILDSFADQVIQKRYIAAEDRKWLLDQLYNAGVMRVPADEVYQIGREYVTKGRIYVPESVKADFGDDWKAFRSRAFGSQIYLTSDRSAGGIDQWNQELAGILPGLFDSEETDARVMLERIVDIAEEGKDEKMSLPEYTAMLAGQDYITENEFLDDMERKLDNSIRVLEEGAELEKKLNWKLEKDRYQRAIERNRHRDAMERAQEQKELKALQQKTLKSLQWLSQNRHKAPEDLRNKIDDALSDIDILAVGAANAMNYSPKYGDYWENLVNAIAAAKKADPMFEPSNDLKDIQMRLEGRKLEDMTVEQLRDLLNMAVGIRTEMQNRKNIMLDEENRMFEDVYPEIKRGFQEADTGFDGKIKFNFRTGKIEFPENAGQKPGASKLESFFNDSQLTPMNVMQRMVGWDPDNPFYSIFAKQLEKGERDMRAYRVKAERMLESFLRDHKEWIKRADGQGKDGIWYKVEVPVLVSMSFDGKPVLGKTETVWMTPMMKVHMYLESKNMDNLTHMEGGRTFADKEIYKNGNREDAFSRGKTIKLAPETVRAMVKDLTPEEKELAAILEKYYNGMAREEINKVSNVVDGFDKAIGKNYAPIFSNQNYVRKEVGKTDTTASGVGSLKKRDHGRNATYQISALDAFERNVDDLARYVGMTIPEMNWNRLMNYGDMTSSMRDVITHKWGDKGTQYLDDLLVALEKGTKAEREIISTTLGEMQSSYISAVFGANPSIVFKQLGSIPMAAPYLGLKNRPSASQIRNIDRSLINTYTQELEWRTMGYSIPETKQLKDNPRGIWDSDAVRKISGTHADQVEKAGKFLFEGDAIVAMDGWAASTLWPWAENKVRNEHPELAVGTEEQIRAGESPFYKKVAEEFDNAVSRSQSVSDEIHQSTMRKSQNPVTKAFTMFKSDSAQTYNALRQKAGEMQFYKRTGNLEKARQARKELGAVIGAALLNNTWAALITFAMAFWKRRDKRYRNEEGELTAASIALEAMDDAAENLMGIIAGGEELYGLIGNILTGKRPYDIDTPGISQLNDALKTAEESFNELRPIAAGSMNILKNGGDLGAYLRKHGADLLGVVKRVAVTTAKYSGIPAENLEAYLIGAIGHIAPEAGIHYDDTFRAPSKANLAGLTGKRLEGRMEDILRNRGIRLDRSTIRELAAEYAAGNRWAFPGDVPNSVSIHNEDRKLSAIQEQTYDIVWGRTVGENLDELIGSDDYQKGDTKTRQRILDRLYDHAAALAKAELFDDYELTKGMRESLEMIQAGVSLNDLILWDTKISAEDENGKRLKSGEKAELLRKWKLPDSAKKLIFQHDITESYQEKLPKILAAGVSFDKFLRIYSEYNRIDNTDQKAGGKALEFARWLDGQGLSRNQVDTIKENMKYFGMMPVDAGKYEKYTAAGLTSDEAYQLTEDLEALEPEEGQTDVSTLQKWRVSVDFSDDERDQLAALSMVMSDSQMRKCEMAGTYGISPRDYVNAQETKLLYDEDGNGSYKQSEIQAALDSLQMSNTQRAVLWQLMTGSKSAKKNPYSTAEGQRVIDLLASEKEKAEESGTFSDEVMRQLTGGK